MDKSELIKELTSSINTIYYVMGECKDYNVENELYQVVYSLERVISEIENE